MPSVATTRWPTMADYQEAIQSPSLCFSDPELKTGTPVTDKLGLPRPICGQFASVYEIETGSRRSAVKCFLRNIPDQHRRYAKISKHINRQKSPYFVTFQYQNEGIRVHGAPRPLVKMAWVEGLALNQFIESNLSEPRVLLDLESRWLDLLEHLGSVKIAHGDLQHGNVLVAKDGNLRLIDYDGMWVPALEGRTGHETGHPDFQSPLRTDKDFHDEIDFFAGAVIQIAIRALSRDPKLWERHNNGDNLLFRRQDYLDPARSPLIAELKALGDRVIDDKLALVIKACATLPKRGELAASAARRRGRQKSEKPANEKAATTQGPGPAGTRGAAETGGESRPVAPASAASRRRPGLLRFALHVAVLPPVVLPSVAEWMELLRVDAQAMSFAERTVLGALSFLGVLSLGTLVVFRRCHRAASGRFFGFMTLLGIYDIAFKISTDGLPRLVDAKDGSLDPYRASACLVVLSFIGWLSRPRPEWPPPKARSSG